MTHAHTGASTQEDEGNASARPYELLVFDFDGTLADSLEAIYSSTFETFRYFGYPLPSEEDIYAGIGKALELNLQRMAPDIAGETLDQWVLYYRQYYQEHAHTSVRLYPHAGEMLKSAKAAGYSLAVLSNKGQDALRAHTRDLGLDPTLDAVVGACPGVRRKPDPQTFDDILSPRFASPAPHRVLMVGDAEPDLAFARNVGAHACFMRHGFGNEPACMAYSPELVVENFQELSAKLGLES